MLHIFLPLPGKKFLIQLLNANKQALAYLSQCHRFRLCMARLARKPWSCSIAAILLFYAPCWDEMKRLESLDVLYWTAAPSLHR